MKPSVSYAGKPDSYYVNARPEMLAFFPPQPGRVLDVGCGGGRFGAMVKDKFPGVEVWGVEPSADAHRQATQALDQALHGLFDDSLGLPEAAFDVIVFNDSLEHFPDTTPPLSLARRLLAPGGRLVLSVPNVRHWTTFKNYLFGGDWRYEAEGVLDRTHLRFFTQRSIARTLAEAGYAVQRVEGLNHCWPDIRRGLIKTLAPKGMQDIPYLQIAVVAVKADSAGSADIGSTPPSPLHPGSSHVEN